METRQTVAARKRVTMQFSLTNADGVVIREAGGAPVSYVHGVGQLFPRLEEALAGHRVGDIVRVKLFPDDAFGERDLDRVIEVPRERIPPGETVEVGGSLIGTTSEGEKVRFTVTRADGERVALDGNHPLAGQTLIFEVEIQGIRDATEEDLLASAPAASGLTNR